MVKLWLVMFVKNGLFTKQLFFSLLARVLLSHLSVDVLQESACDCLSEIINKGMVEGFMHCHFGMLIHPHVIQELSIDHFCVNM